MTHGDENGNKTKPVKQVIHIYYETIDSITLVFGFCSCDNTNIKRTIFLCRLLQKNRPTSWPTSAAISKTMATPPVIAKSLNTSSSLHRPQCTNMSKLWWKKVASPWVMKAKPVRLN